MHCHIAVINSLSLKTKGFEVGIKSVLKRSGGLIRKCLVGCCIAGSAFMAAPASAATLLFNLESLDNYPTRINASWTAESSPTPSYVGSSSFYITVSYLTGDPGNGDYNVGFFTPDYAQNGGLFIAGVMLTGSQVFTGPLQNPTFLIGSFDFYTGVFHQGHELLTITNEAPIASAVPEPSTWAMMILGFVGIGFMACRRKQNGPQLRLA
jgi:hypothetical protein